ncbi:SDR family oxidoreductase [Acidiferrimicrobium sp. IK]|uniref:SDR family oxidoreductase n=1 Tax=Acidiferrimicrobium sp. IK TaxID=2871700 RepID=UPI003966A602
MHARPQDLEAAGQRVFARQAEVRDRESLRNALEAGLRELGHLDVVVAIAGICPMGTGNPMDFVDATDVDLIGVMNTVPVAIPHLPDGASVVITGSTAGLMEGATDTGTMGWGGMGYSWAKKTLVGYTEKMALVLAPKKIRVNAVHPTNCNTHLLHNDEVYKVFRPDLDNPTEEDVMPAFTYFQAMPVPYVEPLDISNAVLYIASEESRYVTGQQLRVDAGSLLRWPNGPQA